MNYPFAGTVKLIVGFLVAREYKQIENLTSGNRLSAEDIASAVQQYGRTLILPPDDAYEILDVVQVRNVSPPRWSVQMNLWTLEEGNSDLSLELTITENGDDYLVELDDIHVL